MQTGYNSLVALPGVGVGLADALYESGFYSAEEISQANIEDLVQIRGIGEEKDAENRAQYIPADEATEEDTSTEAAETDTTSEKDALAPSEPSEETGPEPSDDGEPEPSEEVGPEPSDENETNPPADVGPEPTDDGESEPPEEKGSEDKND